MFSEIIRLRLIDERKSAGYTQQELANQTGIDDSLIAKMEVGKRKPDVEIVGKLASFYGVSIDYLYGLGKKESINN